MNHVHTYLMGFTHSWHTSFLVVFGGLGSQPPAVWIVCLSLCSPLQLWRTNHCHLIWNTSILVCQCGNVTTETRFKKLWDTEAYTSLLFFVAHLYHNLDFLFYLLTRQNKKKELRIATYEHDIKYGMSHSHFSAKCRVHSSFRTFCLDSAFRIESLLFSTVDAGLPQVDLIPVQLCVALVCF